MTDVITAGAARTPPPVDPVDAAATVPAVPLRRHAAVGPRPPTRTPDPGAPPLPDQSEESADGSACVAPGRPPCRVPVSADRRRRILALLADGTDPSRETTRLCEVSAEVAEASGAGIMLMSGDVPRGSLCSTDPVSQVIEDLQFELGEGPCIDAFRFDRPVMEVDLAHPLILRWPAFTEPAVKAGARAVFGFPLAIGAVRLGALNLYRDSVGPLSDDQHADALLMADIAARAVLVLQADAAPGELTSELEAGADFKYVVHQAAGMVSAQLDVTITEALIRLRAHAFGSGKPLTAVATAVVGRTLRFDPATGDAGAAPG